MPQRVATWRFWTLAGIALVDWLVLVVPLVPLAMILGAVVAPEWLRRAARFLDALADAR